MFKKKTAFFIEKVKKLNGDPHTLALGMAIGVFVACTPTIPFHTILGIALAILFKASKPAAILGVWASNPFTVVFLYFACYKVGHLFWGGSSQAVRSIALLIKHLESDIEFSQKITYFMEFIKIKTQTFMIMNAGGIIIGFPMAAVAYYSTKKFIIQLRNKKQSS